MHTAHDIGLGLLWAWGVTTALVMGYALSVFRWRRK